LLQNKDLISNENSDLGRFLDEFLVPVLAAPNQKWPEEISAIENGRFGYLKRSRNEERIDIWTDFGITGESKDYKGALSSSVLKSIIDRIPSDSRVHIVFVRLLQKAYFKKKKLQRTDISIGVAKLDDNSGCLNLLSIPGLPSLESYKMASKLMVFFEVAR
jgi:hypothetical protein